MQKRLRGWLNELPMRDPIERRQAPLIQAMLLGLIVLDTLSLPIALISPSTTARAKALSVGAILLDLVLYPVALSLLRRGRFAAAVALTALGMLASIAILLMPTGLNSSWITLLLLVYPITFAGLLAQRRMLWLTIALSILVVFGLGMLGQIAPALVGYDAPGAKLSAEVVGSYAFIVTFLGLGFDRFGSALRDALGSAMLREQELEQVRDSQETIIADRTTALQQALHAVEQREADLVQTLSDLSASQDALRELSAPVIPVLPGVLVAPLVGALDSARAQMLTSNLLSAVEQQHAHYIIFDITGVPLVDTHVARVLIQSTTAIQLLGAQVLLVGIRPEVAQTMVALNVDLGTIVTYSNLQEAVTTLLRHDGWRRTAIGSPAIASSQMMS
jgi:anti-anti-sigma regulatory factor